MKMGQKAGLYPAIVSSKDYVYIYKTMIKIKMQSEKASAVKYDQLTDVQGNRLNYNEFKELMLKIAIVGKYKLGGGPDMSVEEQKIHKDQEK